jgi:periplasmic divalent cation tolerance protein
MKPLLVYITTKDQKEAEKIASVVLKKRLASCANIIPKISSQYWWKGKLVKDAESVLLLKTFDINFAKLEKAVKQQHSYTVPCIVAFEIKRGNKDYLRWSKKECI